MLNNTLNIYPFQGLLEFPISQILTTPKKNLTNKIDKTLKERCDEHLSDLKVQSKFKEITILESECHSWKKRVQSGLPHGQLSFLLRAGSDSLPHPANLHRWNIQCASKCPLCSSTRPTTTHILNGCPAALQQGRFTWHHDSVLKSIFIHLKDNLPHDVKIYAELDHWRAEDNLLPQSPLRSYPRHQDQILS